MIEAYDHDKHYQMLSEWWIGHGQKPIRKEWLPAVGFVADGVVAGFMYRTDSQCAICEHLVGKPGASRAIVAAIPKLAGAVASVAKHLGYTGLVTNTKHRYLAKLYRDIGAQTQGFRIHRCSLPLEVFDVGA